MSEENELVKAKREAFKNRKRTWIAFLIIFIAGTIIFWIFMFFTHYATIFTTNTLWFIPIQLTPILMLIIMYINLKPKKGLEETNNKDDSLLVRGGSVRAFLIMSVILIIIPYTLERSTELIPIPIPFLVAFSIILVYYEIKPEDVLPKLMIVQIPEHYGTVSRMPIVSTVIGKVEDTIDNIQKKLNEFDKIINNKVIKDINIESAFKELKTVWNEQLDNLVKKINTLVIKSKNKWEQLGIISLLIFIAFANLAFISTRTDPLDGLAIASASLLSVISIVFGIDIQKIMLNEVKGSIDNVFLEANKALQLSKDILRGTFDQAKDRLNDIKDALEKLKYKNLFTFFPKDIVAAITVNLMVFISGLVIMIPTFTENLWVLMGIEFIIGYYFMSKK